MWKITNKLIVQVKDLARKVTSLEEKKVRTTKSTKKLVRASKEKTTALEEKEKEWATRGEEVARLEAEITQLRSEEIHQGDFAKLVGEKVLQTVDLEELVIKMSAAATHIRKYEVLKSLMSECPQLRLRNHRLGWEPYAKERADKL